MKGATAKNEDNTEILGSALEDIIDAYFMRRNNPGIPISESVYVSIARKALEKAKVSETPKKFNRFKPRGNCVK